MSINTDGNLAYSVIEFLEDDGVTVVPSLWLSENKGHCKFPSPVPKNFDKVVAVADSPAEPNWVDYPIKFIKSYGKFFKFFSGSNLFNLITNYIHYLSFIFVDSYKKAAKKANKYIQGKPVDSSECEGQGTRRRKRTDITNITITPPPGSIES